MLETMRNYFNEFGPRATITKTDGPTPMSFAIDVISFDEVGISCRVGGMKIAGNQPIMIDPPGEIQCFTWGGISTLKFGWNMNS